MGHSSAMTETSLRAAPRVFRGPGGAGLPNLVGLRGVHRTDETAAQTTETERFDTADLGLAAAGVTLALHRDVDPPAQWRLDLPDGDGDRDTARAVRVRQPLRRPRLSCSS